MDGLERREALAQEVGGGLERRRRRPRPSAARRGARRRGRARSACAPTASRPRSYAAPSACSERSVEVGGERRGVARSAGRWCRRRAPHDRGEAYATSGASDPAGVRRCRDGCRAIQRIVVHRNDDPEEDHEHHESVMTRSRSASAAALISGRMLGAGMWISSPTGGAVPLLVELAVAHWIVDERGDEGQGEHQQPDDAGEVGGAEVAACELAIHRAASLQLSVQHHRDEQHREVAEGEQVRAQRALAVRAALQAQRERDEGRRRARRRRRRR